MVQILEESPGLGARFAQGLGRGLSGESQNNFVQQFAQMIQQKQMQEKQAKDLAAADQFYEDNYGIKLKGEKNPEMRKILLSKALEQQSKDSKEEKDSAPVQQAFDTLHRMRQIRSKGNLGMFSKVGGLVSEDTRRDRGEYEQLGKSLIQLSTNIPIRNRLEFETLAEKLYDPSVTDAEAEGILDAMERILKGTSVGKKSQGEQLKSAGSIDRPGVSGSKDKKPLGSFMGK